MELASCTSPQIYRFVVMQIDISCSYDMLVPPVRIEGMQVQEYLSH